MSASLATVIPCVLYVVRWACMAATLVRKPLITQGIKYGIKAYAFLV